MDLELSRPFLLVFVERQVKGSLVEIGYDHQRARLVGSRSFLNFDGFPRIRQDSSNTGDGI